MKPFTPTRLVGRFPGGAIVAEDDPFAFEAVASYRGVEITEIFRLGAAYREAPAIAAERVVVREPHPHVSGDEHFLTMFQRSLGELAALAGTPAPQLRHALGRDGTVLAAVVDHIGGVSAETVLEAARARGLLLPVEVALAIASELVALWQKPLERELPVELHLGPGDIWITSEGRVRATPELASERARQTVGAAVGIIEGNIGYVSPEQIDGYPIGPTSGMFTLGLLLYELLTNAHPVSSSTMFELLSKLRGEDLPPLASRRAVPREVAAFVARTTARDPARRWPSWAALASALGELRARLPAVGPTELLAALPARPPAEPAIELAALGDWRALPDDRLGPLPPRLRRERDTLAERLDVRVDADVVFAGNDRRPMYAAGPLLVDARPVTAAEFQRFVLAISGRVDPRDAADTPCTNVGYEQAAAYAAWAGKRLPTEQEWAAAVAAHGAERLGTGAVWEWTSTRAPEGRIVRGGRWRNDLERPPVPGNRSFETGPAPDLGFRCVCERED